MCDGWKSYRSAPSIGTLVCSAGSIPDAGFRSVVATSAAGTFPILVFKTGDAVHAFVNACPINTYRLTIVVTASSALTEP